MKRLPLVSVHATKHTRRPDSVHVDGKNIPKTHRALVDVGLDRATATISIYPTAAVLRQVRDYLSNLLEHARDDRTLMNSAWQGPTLPDIFGLEHITTLRLDLSHDSTVSLEIVVPVDPEVVTGITDATKKE